MCNNEPAFPVQDASKWQAHGMSLRDYFAAKAMQSILAGAMEQGGATEAEDALTLTRRAWLMADAMLATRKPPNVAGNRIDPACRGNSG